MESIDGKSKGHLSQQAAVKYESGSCSGAVSPAKELNQIADLLSLGDGYVKHYPEAALSIEESSQISRPVVALSTEKEVDDQELFFAAHRKPSENHHIQHLKEIKEGNSNGKSSLPDRVAFGPWAHQRKRALLNNPEVKEKPPSGSFSGVFLKPSSEGSRQDFRQEQIQKWVSTHKFSEESLPSYYWAGQYPQTPVTIQEKKQELSIGKSKETIMHARKPESDTTRLFFKTSSRQANISKRSGLPLGQNLDENALKRRRVEVMAMDAKTTMARSLAIKKEAIDCRQTDSRGVIGSGDYVTLRQWLGKPKRVVGRLECLHIFKQILEQVCAAHSQGITLGNVYPSSFLLSSLHRVKFIDNASSSSSSLKPCTSMGRLEKEDSQSDETRHLSAAKSPMDRSKANTNHTGSLKKVPSSLCNHSIVMNDHNTAGLGSACFHKQRFCSQRICSSAVECVTNSGNLVEAGIPTEKVLETNGENRMHQNSASMPVMNSYEGDAGLPTKSSAFLEEAWYTSPEELMDRPFSCSSDIYSLGVLFFELFAPFNSSDEHIKLMSDLRHRILPPWLLSKHPKEVAFCLWMLHPDPDSRPKARDVLHSELLNEVREALAERQEAVNIEEKKAEADLLLDFLLQVQQQKQEHASKLSQEISCLTSDLEEVRKRNTRLMSNGTVPIGDQETLAINDRFADRPNVLNTLPERVAKVHDNSSKDVSASTSTEMSCRQEDISCRSARLMSNFKHLEQAYYLMRWKVEAESSSTKQTLPNAEKMHMRDERSQDKEDRLGCFFDSLCKYARYSGFKVKATLRHGDLLNTANMVCSLGFDRDEEYFATAGVCKRIKVFDCNLVMNDNVDIHYPVIEMVSKSKLSSICWNGYIKSHIVSSDYDGVLQLWDASRGQPIMQYEEHEKRVWSVDFSQADPTRLASGSDDGSVKIWSINQEASIATIKTKANVCSVQFRTNSSHSLAFGSADYKVYCYDLRNIKVPWCVMDNHNKAVSYVKFLDASTLVSASTDNTLKLWDLSRVSSMATICKDSALTFTGHKNEKNFVGLSVMDGYIACGSETNSVIAYHKSFPMPIASHKFGSTDPVSGQEIEDDAGHFVSSVCWQGKSRTLVAANSVGYIKLLEMV